MKARAVVYWIATVLVAFVLLSGGIVGLMQRPESVQGMAHLGYPAYFGLLLGVWKILGAIALLAPRFPRLKEWAYAGTFFDFTSAAVSLAAVHDPISHIVGPLLFTLVLVASWALRPASRVVGGPVAVPVATP
jgi:uncharacterized membrane protein YphA (DoxX/SURF4 family)